MTDFFGGVASVEITTATEALDPETVPWEIANKEKASALESQTVGSPTSISGWKRPLEGQTGMVDGVKTGVSLGVVAVITWIMVRPKL